MHNKCLLNGLAKYYLKDSFGLWAKSTLWPVCVGLSGSEWFVYFLGTVKHIYRHTYTHHYVTETMALWLQSLKYLLSFPSQKTFCNPCFIRMLLLASLDLCLRVRFLLVLLLSDPLALKLAKAFFSCQWFAPT